MGAWFRKGSFFSVIFSPVRNEHRAGTKLSVHVHGRASVYSYELHPSPRSDPPPLAKGINHGSFGREIVKVSYGLNFLNLAFFF